MCGCANLQAPTALSAERRAPHGGWRCRVPCVLERLRSDPSGRVFRIGPERRYTGVQPLLAVCLDELDLRGARRPQPRQDGGDRRRGKLLRLAQKPALVAAAPLSLRVEVRRKGTQQHQADILLVDREVREVHRQRPRSDRHFRREFVMPALRHAHHRELDIGERIAKPAHGIGEAVCSGGSARHRLGASPAVPGSRNRRP